MSVNIDPQNLQAQLQGTMQVDRFRLRRRLQRWLKHPGQEDAAALAELAADVEASMARRQARIDRKPATKLDDSLPIFHRREEIVSAIADHAVVVVSGATGSGKSTQLPLLALEAGYGIAGQIGHTQPRRIAARGVASRIAQQLGTPLGTDVGFKIRFADQSNAEGYIKLMTDGILLAETQSDRFLDQYDLVIVDEAHERSLNIDFLLGYLKRILEKRPDFRLVITSATIDTARFAEHFQQPGRPPVPVIDVEGRTYPVELRYQPPPLLADGEPRALEDHVVSVCQELAAEDPGDMLVFLPTESDIRTVHRKMRSARGLSDAAEILPLYARLSTDQQNQIFQPGAARRVVLATNVAESSITVPRIRFVVDTGTARISHYAARTKVQRLPIQAISQASARQRAGRCGRIGPGVCVRLYSEEDFDGRPEFTTPEIRRTNLASVILQSLALRLGPIEQFPFIDPPRPESIRDGFKTLYELGAVDEQRQLTSIGRQLARLPVDPRIGRMILAADEENCLAEVLIIAAGLELQDPRQRPPERQQAADQQHEKFVDERSDFLSLLKIWDFFHQLKEDLSRSRLQKACQQNFLSYPLLRQWQDIHRQLLAMVRQQKLTVRSRKDDAAAIHRSLLAGLLSGVALLTDRHEYTGAGNVKFHLWPGSGVFAGKPKWIMAAELVETSRRYGRTVARISPEWIEPLAGHLTRHRYADPHWSQKHQTVRASEFVTLFGIPIVSGRKVAYGPVDAEVSRDLFIEQALAEELPAPNIGCLQHNAWVLEQIRQQVAKTRQREWVVDRLQLIAFYQERLPAGIFDYQRLQQAIQQRPELDVELRMTRADLLGDGRVADLDSQFPDTVSVGSMQVPVSYRFSPGASDDGATIRVPLAGLGQLDDVQTGWLVPGLLEPRVVALIRSLPKGVRRNLVPAPDTARQVAAQIDFGKGHFLEAVAAELTRIGGLPISASQFKTEKLDDHLRVNLQVVDDDGQLLAEGRSLSEIRSQLGPEHASNLVEVPDQNWQQDGLRDWTWEDLPAEVMIRRGATQLATFPAIVDQEDAVGLRLADSPAAAQRLTRQGLVRLLGIPLRKAVRSNVNWLPDLDRHALLLGSLVSSTDLKRALGDLLVRIGLVEGQPIPRTRQDFEKRLQGATERLGIACQEIARWLPRWAAAVQTVQLALQELPARHAAAQEDIRRQIEGLAEDGFLSRTAWAWLQHYPRYFEAMEQRLERLQAGGAERDREGCELLASYLQQRDAARLAHQQQRIVDPELETFAWMIEELRVSLFAQKLGTAIKVSPQRLEKQWAQVRQV